jgi:hypothetical protein
VKTVGDKHFIKKVIKGVTKIAKGQVPVVLLILSTLFERKCEVRLSGFAKLLSTVFLNIFAKNAVLYLRMFAENLIITSCLHKTQCGKTQY